VWLWRGETVSSGACFVATPFLFRLDGLNLLLSLMWRNKRKNGAKRNDDAQFPNVVFDLSEDFRESPVIFEIEFEFVYEKRVLSPRFCATFLFSSNFFKLCYDKNRTTNKEKTLLLFTAKNMKVIHTYSFMKKLLKKGYDTSDTL
jgi:hypothetical protein